MKNKISYTIKAIFYRRKIGDKMQYLQDNTELKKAVCQIEKSFEDELPNIARAQAFDFFQSIVDVLYESLGKEYFSDEQARIDLQHFFNSGNAVEVGPKENRFKISDDFLNGIFVYLVVEDQESKTRNEIQIHSLNYLDYPDEFDESIIESLKGLIEEFRIYQENDYPVNGLSLKTKDQNGKEKQVLKTPFAWD